MSKPTVATLKSFVRKNRDRLLVNVRSQFNGMTDGCESTGDVSYTPAQPAEHVEHTLGVHGVWIVGRSRDSIMPLSEPGLIGFHVYNSCGSFNVAVRA